MQGSASQMAKINTSTSGRTVYKQLQHNIGHVEHADNILENYNLSSETILKRTQFMVTACYVLLNVIQHDVHLFRLLMLLLVFFLSFSFYLFLSLQLLLLLLLLQLCRNHFLFATENMSFSPNFWSE